MQVQPQVNPDLLRECRLREYQVGRITILRFKEALRVLAPDLEDSEFKKLIREMDTASGIIEYLKELQKVDF